MDVESSKSTSSGEEIPMVVTNFMLMPDVFSRVLYPAGVYLLRFLNRMPLLQPNYVPVDGKPSHEMDSRL